MGHARNTHEVLGKDCNTPSKFVLCWTEGIAGTQQVVRVAEGYGIPVCNADDVSEEGIWEWVKSHVIV